MGMELDEDRVIADYAAGRPVGEIQSAYGLTRAEIEYLVGERSSESTRRRPSGWSLALLGLVAAAAVVIFVSALAGGGSDIPPDPSGDAKRVCQEQFIPNRLKAPATAEFSGVAVTSAGDVYTVTGFVDAENAFGALIRSSFICIVRDAGQNWVLQSATVVG